MKSIIEQASSIIKAIEKAWERAGKPQDFTVKIFEHEQKNFFGLTAKPAKIGFFFEGKPGVVPKEPKIRPKPTAKPPKPPVAKPPVKEQRPREPWSDEMVTTAQAWVKKSLQLMGLPNISFSTNVSGNHLKLTFDAPVIGNHMQERQLFRSFAYLIMASLRNQFKQEFRQLKVVLIRA